MRQTKVVLAALALLVLVTGAAQAEMYVEAYLGATQAANIGNDFGIKFSGFPNLTETWRPNGKTDPAVLAGLKLGTWFVKEGFLGYNYPDWMKYLGFYLDFSFHRLDMRTQDLFWDEFVGGAFTLRDRSQIQSEGTVATLAFMFAARYGFLPDSEVPFGRLQPYLAVGPALMFATMEPKIIYAGGGTNKLGSQSDVAICLAAEAGLRYMALKNVSLDLSFKYRYAAPQFSFNYQDYSPAYGRGSFTFKPDYNLFSAQLGAAYHF
jgi:opacity protein-like surface antigen